MHKTRPIIMFLVLALLSFAPGRTFYLLAADPTCPPQVFLDPNTCPVKLDAAKIAVDPYANKPCLLSHKFVVEGLPWLFEGKYCDPDSDPMILTADGANFADRGNGTYTLSGIAGPAGTIVYATMTLRDKPAAGDAITRKGTVAVISVKKNNPPSLCGGLP